MVGARQTGESRTPRQVDEMVKAAARNGSGRLQFGNRRAGMAADVDDGKPVDDLQSKIPMNMAMRNDHFEIVDL